jgi:CheY-like chemotaxis protein
MTCVLVVDDDAAIRQLLTYALSMEGYAVDMLADGREVIGRLRATASRVIVLMDVMMPNMGGLMVCQRLLDEPDLLSRHAIVLMSAGFAPGEPLPEGVRAALAKPFRLERALALVERLGAEPLALTSSEASPEPAVVTVPQA